MKVLANAFWLSLSRTAADVLSFVLFALISRRFGPVGTGEYSYAFAVGGIIALVATSGLEEYGIRQYVRSQAAERAPLWRSILGTQLAQIGLGGVTLAVFLLVSGPGSSPLVLAELVVYSVSFGLARTLFVPATASQAMFAPAVSEFACRFFGVGIALALMPLQGMTLPLILAGFPVGGLALVVLALRNARSHGMPLKLDARWPNVAHTVRGSWAFAASSLLNQFYARADILIISAFLGTAAVGLYATDIKFVEVGLLPLVFLGTAAYPVLSHSAVAERETFQDAARDFVKLVMLLSGWLAVGLYWLIPLLIVPLFGVKFAPSVPLLHWIAAFALLKGGEVALYRMLYSVKRQTTYAASLMVGTAGIVLLNLMLIPQYGLEGAILAGIISTVIINAVCVAGLRSWLSVLFFLKTLGKLGIALGLTTLCVMGAGLLTSSPWLTAVLACAVFPICALLSGLVPHPRHSPLLQHKSSNTLEGVPQQLVTEGGLPESGVAADCKN